MPKKPIIIVAFFAIAILGVAAGVSFDEIHALLTETIGAMQ